MMRAIQILTIAATLGLLPGCSWLFIQPLQDDRNPGEPYTCTTNRAAPVIDTLLAASNVASAAYVANQDNAANKGTAVMAGLSVATLWAVSAGYGYFKTAECEEAISPPRRDDEWPPSYRPRGYRDAGAPPDAM
jgi:hypothetical protein